MTRHRLIRFSDERDDGTARVKFQCADCGLHGDFAIRPASQADHLFAALYDAHQYVAIGEQLCTPDWRRSDGS